MTEQTQPMPLLNRWLLIAVMALLTVGVWAASRSEAATSNVDMQNFAFTPAEVTVRVGDTVTWFNKDSEPHAVQGGPMNSPDIQPGSSFSHTFDQVGHVDYLCRIHTYMTGVVHVVGDNEPTTTTSTTAPPSTTSTTAPPATTTTTTEPGGTTTTTQPGGTTTTTQPGGTTTTTEPGGTTTTTTPPSSGGPAFQDVPDDPSATYPPGTPGSKTPPPSSAPQTTTTTTTQPGPPPPGQEVPNDPDDEDPPNAVLAADEGGSDGGGSEAPAPKDLGDGTFLAPSTTEGGVKVFKLTMAPTTIETAPGVTKEAYAFNGLVPGPVLRVNEGDRVRILVDNQLPFATAVHWHGMILPNAQDGVPGITQPFIDPGERYTYEWTAKAPGTHWYHSHTSGRHIGKGLYGALEVVPRTGDFQADRDYRLLLGDTDLGFVINGRMFPSTTPLVTKVGETVRLRVVNTGDEVHAMHLHGIPFDVVAQDGNKLTVPMRMDTLTISPGQTFDLLAKQENPGKWLLHCHIFRHSHKTTDEHHAGDTGMTGMVTILETKPADSNLPPSPLPLGQPIAASGSGGVPLPGSPSTQTLVLLVGGMAVALTGLRTGGRRRGLLSNPLNRKDSPE
jgi:plastocyanin/uncharacterized cupredoxin-like copper-binding protein